MSAWMGWILAGLAILALAWVWTQRKQGVPPPAVQVEGRPPAAGMEPIRSSLPAVEGAPVTWESVIGKCKPAVVQVETSRGLGSGFFVSPEKVITNVHVVSGESYVTLRFSDDSTTQASVVSTTPEYDVAVLKIWKPRPEQAFIPLGAATTLQSGQEVMAIGSPRGMQNTVTRGIVSGLRIAGNVTLVQTDAALNPGNSGGPLLDRTGAAIGINTLSFRESPGLNFAVSIEHARAILEGRPQAVIPASERDRNNRIPSPVAPTETERQRAEGTRLYEMRLAVIAQRAASLDSDWAYFRAQGYEGQITGSFDRGWYVVWEPACLKGKIILGYEGAFEEIKRRAEGIKSMVLATEDEGRKADVYPGERRELRQKYHLDYQGWGL